MEVSGLIPDHLQNTHVFACTNRTLKIIDQLEISSSQNDSLEGPAR